MKQFFRFDASPCKCWFLHWRKGKKCHNAFKFHKNIIRGVRDESKKIGKCSNIKKYQKELKIFKEESANDEMFVLCKFGTGREKICIQTRFIIDHGNLFA